MNEAPPDFWDSEELKYTGMLFPEKFESKYLNIQGGELERAEVDLKISPKTFDVRDTFTKLI